MYEDGFGWFDLFDVIAWLQDPLTQVLGRLSGQDMDAVNDQIKTVLEDWSFWMTCTSP